MDSSNTPRRAILISWSGVAGALALVAGGIAFLIIGEVSIVVFACVVAGILGIGVWMWAAPGEFQAWITGRQTTYATTSVLITVLFIGFIIFAYLLVDRANITVDLTSRQRYSLSPTTLNTIQQLQDRGFRVRIVGFFSRNMLREQESADLLLRQYEAEGNGAIEVAYVDPDEQPNIAQQYGYQPGYDGDLFLSVLGPNGSPNPNAPPLYLGDVDERDITTGLKTIASAGRFKVYFTTGHGELSLDRVDKTGISRLRVSLEGAGIAVEPLRLLDVVNTGIPDDASALIIAGARTPFVEAEVQLIDEYMQRGGRLAVFTDPPEVDIGAALTNTFLKEGSPFNEYLWNEFGIRVRDTVVIETRLAIGNEFTLLVDQIAPHAMLADVRDAQIVMQFVRALELAETPTVEQGRYIREPLLYSSDGSFAETDLEGILRESRIGFDQGEDIPGPLLLAVTARYSVESQEETQPRVIVIGDSDVFKNDFVEEYPGNTFLWTDTIDWLTGFVEAVSFSPVSDPTRLSVVVSDRERTTIATITMLILPGSVLLLGGVVWWHRRR